VLASSASSGVTSNDATATVVYCDNIIAIYMTVNFFLNIAILAGPLFIGFECVL